MKRLFSFVFLMLAIMMPAKLWAQEPYAVLSEDNTILTFYYDEKKTERNGMDVQKRINGYWAWKDYAENVITIVFDDSFASCQTLTTTNSWFYGCKNLTSIIGITNLRTDNVTDMGAMFVDCSKLTSIDVSGFNTNNVTDMSGMFQGCSGLTSIDVSGFNTENVTKMNAMFYGCSSLTSLDVSGFKTDNVTYIGSMFCDCSGLTSIDVSGFNTANVTNMVGMFNGCSSLASLDVSGFNTANVTNMRTMFRDCFGLTSLDLSAFNTANVTNMHGMFSSCSGLTRLDVSSFKTDNVTDMSSMFFGCSGLPSLDVSGFKTDNVTRVDGMFYECSGLTSLDVSSFKTDNVTRMDMMFYGCSGLTSLDVSGFKTDNVTRMDWMFLGCSGLTKLDISAFNTANVTNMDGMFCDCSGLISLDLDAFNTANVMSMQSMFHGCSGLTSLDLSHFIISKVIYDIANNNYGIGLMFSGCSKLTAIYVGDGWTTVNLTKSSDVFKECTSLVGGAGTVYDPDHTDYTYAHIDGGKANPGYFTSKDAEPTGDILFADNEVKTLCVANWDTNNDGELSYKEAAAITDLGTVFKENKQIIQFDELKFFTGLSTIGDMAFWNCSGLAAISFPESITSIGARSFVSCKSLTSIVIADSVVSIGESAFGNCENLSSLVIPNSVKTIYNSAFWGCAFTTLSIPASVTYIGPDAFSCSGLTSIMVDKDNTVYDSRDNCNAIIQTSTNKLVAGCQNTVIPNSVLIIGDCAFASCTGLTTLVIPEGVTTIERQAFVSCSALESVTLPQSLITIATAAFQNCKKLTSVIFPASVTSIATYVFEGSDGITSIKVEEGNKVYDSRGDCNAVIETATNQLIVGCKNTIIPTDVTFIADGAFCQCSGLVSITIPDGVTTIGKNAFDYCGLGSVVIPNSVSTIDDWAFFGCSELASVTIPNSMVSIGEHVFQNCNKLNIINSMIEKPFPINSDVFSTYSTATLYVPVGTKSIYEMTDGWNLFQNIVEEIPDTVKKPTFEFAYNWYNDLTIKTETEDAEIYYTMNGRMLEREEANFGYSTLGRYSNWKAWGDNLQEAKSEYNEDVYSGYGSNYVLKLTSRVDSVMESAQLGYRFNKALTKNDYYTVHFQARSASGNGQIQFFCQNDTLTTKYRSAADTMAIGKEWADYEFTLKIDNDSTNQIVLNFGGVADTYYIDNVLFGPVISDTINGNLRTRYESPIEIQDDVTITAVAVKEGMKESKPTVYDYFYDGWMNLLYTYEKGRVLLEECYGDPNVPLQDVDAMKMRLEDMLYSYYERRTEKRFDDNELLYAADEMLARLDMIYQMKEGFVIDGVAYHAVDSTQVEVRKPLSYYDSYKGAITIAHEVFHNNINFRVTSVTDDAFANSELSAIVWNADFTVPDAVSTMVNNPNLLVYVNSDALAPKNMTNVVINGWAKTIVLTDTKEGNGNFCCPQAFTAEKVSYTREFLQETQVGVSRGWESLALPFTVQTITHEKQGEIAPFGNSTSTKHFWLRCLGNGGLTQATSIEANVPYIISMPNDSENYAEAFNLAGRVTFVAQEVTIPVTEPVTLALADSTIKMVPAFQSVVRSSDVWAINVGETRGQYFEGSVFERDYREVRPFEAYTVHTSDGSAPRFVPIREIGGATGIEDVRELMYDGRSDVWYDLNGRRLQGEPTQKGVYIKNGRKQVVK